MERLLAVINNLFDTNKTYTPVMHSYHNEHYIMCNLVIMSVRCDQIGACAKLKNEYKMMNL